MRGKIVYKWLKIAHKKLVNNLLFPQHCLVCLGQPLSEQSFCQSCYDMLPWLKQSYCQQCALPVLNLAPLCGACFKQKPHYDKLQAVFDYHEPIDKFINQLKFSKKLYFAKTLAEIMVQHLEVSMPIDAIVPVPLHPKRQQQRGFNQSLELAKEIAKCTNIPLIRNACHRSRNTSPQMQLPASRRKVNLSEKTFTVTSVLKDKCVLVVEDVVTTGTTVNAFAKALKQSGVAAVEVWACCRTLLS